MTGAAPNWEFDFGRGGRRVQAFGRAVRKDDYGMTAASEGHAVPGIAFERMIRSGRARLGTVSIVRKGIQ